MCRILCEPDDQRLFVLRAQQGDAAAIETLIDMHRPFLYALIKRLKCMSISREELLQAGVLGFLQAVKRYDQRQNTKLTTYAYPWILGEMRRAIRAAESNRISLDETVGNADSLRLCDILAGGEGIDTERIDLHLALSRLEQEEWMLLCLRYFRDMTQKETAVLMKKSQTQISRLEQRALDRLHAMLEK